MKGVLERLQEEIYGQLRKDSSLADVEIFNYAPRDFGRLATLHLQQNLGLCVLVLPPIPKSFLANHPHPTLAQVEARLRIVQDLALYQGARRALQVAEAVQLSINGAELSESETPHVLTSKLTQPWVVRENFPESTRLEIELVFETELALEGGKK